MNRRRRTGLWMISIGGVGVIATVGLVAAHIAKVDSQVGNLVSVVALTADVDRFQTITEELVEIRRVPARWTPETRFGSIEDVTQMQAAAPLPEGSFLQEGMLQYPTSLGPKQRKVPLPVSADPVVTGDVARGDRVAIYGTFVSNDANRHPCLAMLVPMASVARVPEQEEVDSDTITASFVVHKRYVAPLLYAASFGEEIRVVALGPGSQAERPKATKCGPRVPRAVDLIAKAGGKDDRARGGGDRRVSGSKSRRESRRKGGGDGDRRRG